MPHDDEGPGTALWTTAWELLLPTASAPPRRRGRILQEALRDAVRSGRLAPGTRLPSGRALAADLGVSRGLVTEAYEQLTAEGYLHSRRGAGTWVGGAVRATVPPRPTDTPPAGVPLVDFTPGTPDLSLFPRAAWSAAHRRALGRLPHRTLGYPDPRGLPELRAELAQLLTRRRGVVADPQRVVVCSGVAQAMTLLGFTLRAAGHRAVAVEDPGSPEHAQLFAAAGLASVPVPLDDEGPDPTALADSGARAAVLTPSHQFPSGTSVSAPRRAQLLRWARAADGLLIEDDYDGDFRYDRAPVGALQGLDPDRVAYTGSVSKSLAPGLRLGWLVVPERLAAEVVARKRTMDLGNPVLDQALLADFIARGDYDRQLRRCQRAYRERRDALTAALAAHCPGAEVTGIAAGLHVIVTLPARHGPEEAFLTRARRAGLALRPLSAYKSPRPAGDSHVRPGHARPDHPPVDAHVPPDRIRLVLGYAHLSPSDITRGIRLLGEV
ncbi:PLP-dependent aminotransferase family protein [Streptomyces inhibens]|uniref:PLP-dependent aminotransferase family protein n=1 Tax=Streptomyces inhibens TaxID=2293571 RepID=A0A371PXA0_STRIH|nr:PLP-dependent aminotransferase family protein [Streptomyces inhibens]REK86901.1 PLP-dependent aminotransferase family protein [Streptomyces inhibens]